MDNFFTPGEASDWQQTTLWQELQKKATPEAELVRTALKQYMPEIQRILAQGSTSPTDFTLHDPGHAFRTVSLCVYTITAVFKPSACIAGGNGQ